MAEFDFAPRPPRQEDDAEQASPFASHSGLPHGDEHDGGYQQFAPPAEDKDSLAQRAAAAAQGPFAGPPPSQSAGPRQKLSDPDSPFAAVRQMATMMGMARHSNAHVDPISSPTGLLSLIRGGMQGQHDKADDHSFKLDATANASSGGGFGGMATALGTIGGPLRGQAQNAATSSAMQALGGMAKNLGGGLQASLGHLNMPVRQHMHWLDKGVKSLYKIKR